MLYLPGQLLQEPLSPQQATVTNASTGDPQSERRGILWRWRGPSGLRWVWRNAGAYLVDSYAFINQLSGHWSRG